MFRIKCKVSGYYLKSDKSEYKWNLNRSLCHMFATRLAAERCIAKLFLTNVEIV